MRPRRGPVRLLWDGTLRWLLGGGRSVTHPGTGIILPYQLVLTTCTKTPAPAPLLPIWASLLAVRGAVAPLARSRRDWSGMKLLKAVLGAAAAPGIGNGPRQLLWHPSAETATGTSYRNQTPPGDTDPGREKPRHHRMHLVSSIPTAPLLYRGRGSPIARERAAGELGSSCCIPPASAQTTQKLAKLPQKTLPVQLRGPTPPIFLATI